MHDYGRRIVVDLGFEAALGELSRALREEGLQVLARIDVRNEFRRDLGRDDFRGYFLLDAWSPELALDALRHDRDVGPVFPASFAIYELSDSKTAVVAKGPLCPVSTDLEWRRGAPAIASLGDQESDRVSRALARLQEFARHGPAIVAG